MSTVYCDFHHSYHIYPPMWFKMKHNVQIWVKFIRKKFNIIVNIKMSFILSTKFMKSIYIHYGKIDICSCLIILQTVVLVTYTYLINFSINKKKTENVETKDLLIHYNICSIESTKEWENDLQNWISSICVLSRLKFLHRVKTIKSYQNSKNTTVSPCPWQK